MRSLRTFLTLCMLLLSLTPPASAEEGLTLAAGAGYRRLVEEVCTAFTEKTGTPVQRIFGNMGQILAQAQESGTVDFILGDKQYLDGTSLPFTAEFVIGKGKLVAAVAKGLTITSLDELTTPAVTRIAIADSKTAIFGLAAMECLTRKGIWEQVEPKLLMVGTVPQVTAYVVSGEADVGFINLTEALAIKDKVERLLPVDEGLYSPILIVAKRLRQSKNDAAAEAFVRFLQTEQAQAMIKKQGL